MYRALPASKQVSKTAGRGALRVIRRRNFATESAPAPTTPKKKPRIIRRIFFATATLTGTFYVGSAFVSFKSQKYYDFFTDNVPLGQSMMEYAESNRWDRVTAKSIYDKTVDTATSVQKFVMEKINGVPHTREDLDKLKTQTEKKAREAKVSVIKTIDETKEKAKELADKVKTEVTKEEGRINAVVKHQTEQVKEEVSSLVQKAEEALGKVPVPKGADPSPPSEPSPAPEGQTPSSYAPSPPSDIYPDLPVGFEPPSGYKPPPKPKPTERKPVDLPLVTPAVSSLNASEPVISHLATIIDSLASYLKTNPSAAERVRGVLDNAKADLTLLAERIEKAKSEERAALEAKMDEQTRDYTIKMLEAEMDAQDKLDNQEDEFRKMFDLQQAQMVQAYREKLQNELDTQSELINERLKKEVIAQGIELQRRWIREIKMQVESERGGRLAKIDELSAHLKRIERVALDNSAYLDENIRVHALWSALRALSGSSIGAPVRKPFRDELRVVRHIAAAREDPVVAAALETLEKSSTPDVGVEPLADLATWYTSSVQPKVSTVALVPESEPAGALAHLASWAFSQFTFKRHGLVEGKDVLSVLARAEYYLNEKKDLDSAARELNQLKGSAGLLLTDWLEAARRRLEVEQAIDVIQSQATLASLLVVE